MKKIIKRSLTLAMALTIPFSAIACGGGAKAKNTVRFWAYGSMEELAMYRSLVDAFNDGYGAENGVKVQMLNKPVDGYQTSFEMAAADEGDVDLGLISDNEFKTWVFNGTIGNLQSYVNDHIEMYESADLFDSVTNRYRVDLVTNTSNPDDPLYAIPFDTMPTALYYNETYFKNAGIKIISVDEEDMDAWNAGTIKDLNGNSKADLGITINVPKKGYYRSKNPYDASAGLWTKPASDEVLIFNNRIAMNWDEVEDVSMLFTQSYNSSSPCKYGYFTEWWFNYGWSVGGDCLADLTGSGKWNFSLLDDNKNYVVKEGKTYVGAVSGTTYQAGDSLPFYDKMNVTADNMNSVVADEEGGYLLNDQVLSVRSAVVEEATKADGALQELASTKDAFLRYLRLGSSKTADVNGEGGLAISPDPNTINAGGKGSTYWFTTGQLALLAQTSAYMADISKAVTKWEWNVAPLAQYKEYVDPTDPNCDTVKAIGTESGHSNAKTLCVADTSTKKDEAVQFALWCASEEAQKIRTSQGFFPLSEKHIDDISFDSNANAPKNAKIFGRAIKNQGPGDWWYMPDHVWVEDWCVILNAEVRVGTTSYANWYKGAIQRTNARLVEYEKFKRAK